MYLGHFEYLVMPFVLTNALAVFQALLTNVLRDLLNRVVFIYLDNIGLPIFFRSLEEHVNYLHNVLHRLLENRLYVKVETCDFHVETANFLVTWWRKDSSERTQPRWKRLRIGQSLPLARSCNVFLGLQIFIGDSLL